MEFPALHFLEVLERHPGGFRAPNHNAGRRLKTLRKRVRWG